MDSMRSLNSSLPRAGASNQPASKPSTNTPSEHLLQAFKDAALSVTKLYKTAAADQVSTRAEGFQDCLEDLLTFMDREDIGLNDGEGWKIRQWATQRLDGQRERNLSDDEEMNSDKERASSPVAQRKSAATVDSSPMRAEPVQQVAQQQEVPEIVEEEQTPPASQAMQFPGHPPTGNFSFKSDVAYPQEVEMEDGGEAVVNSSLVNAMSNPAVTFARTANRSGNRPRNIRHSSRTVTAKNVRRAQEQDGGAGQKRKINFGEFFDIGDSLNPFGGGGKRSRFT